MRKRLIGALFTGIVASFLIATCPPALMNTASINGSTIPAFTQLVDTGLNVWTVDGTGKCFENSVNVGGCSGVTLLVWYNGNIYADTTGPVWYQWTGSAWNSLGATDPRVPSTPVATLATNTPNLSLVDTSHNVWSAQSNLQCYKNGIQAGVCSNTASLMWMNNHIYQNNTGGNWYRWNNAADTNPNTFTQIASINPMYQFQIGLNFSGMECGNAQDGNPYGHNGQMTAVTPYFSYWQGKQMYTIRLPFLWERLQPTLLGALDTTYLGQIETAVNAAAASQQTVLLDLHNYAAYAPLTGAGGSCTLASGSGNPSSCVAYSSCGCYTVGSTSLPNADLADVWKRLATIFGATVNGVRTYPNILGYDIMNEPSAGSISASQWTSAAQATINAIRTVDTYTPIYVEGVIFSTVNGFGNANPTGTLETLTDSSNKIIFSGHNYANQDSQSYFSTTGSNLAYNANDTPQTMVNNYSGSSTQFKEWCAARVTAGTAKGCHIGEGGVSLGQNSTDQSNLDTMLNNVLAAYQTNNTAFHYWSGGPCGQPQGVQSTNLTPATFGPPATGEAPQWTTTLGNYVPLP